MIYDVPSDVGKDDLTSEIWQRNLEEHGVLEDNKDECIKLLYSLKQSKGDTVNWIVQIFARAREVLYAKERIYIRWRSHRFKDYIMVLRCYKCLAYGHTRESCNIPEMICGHCAESGHTYKDCAKKAAKAVCANCQRKKQKHDHSIRDKNCPEFEKALQWAKRRIQYD